MDELERRQLRHIEEITRNGRATWFGLLFYLVFIVVTLLGVEDADFFVERRRTALPLVDVSIPTLAFFWSAPAVGAALYIYLHLYLVKLWEALAEPGNRVGRDRLGARIYPWLASDWALWLRGDDAQEPRAMNWLVCTVTVLLVWLVPHAALGWFWWESATAHDEWLTIWIGCWWLLAAYVGLRAFAYAWLRLRRRNAPYVPPTLRRSATTWIVPPVAAAVLTVGWARTEGGLESYAGVSAPITTAGIEAVGRRWTGDRDWTPLAPIDLAGVEITPRPDEWREHMVARRKFRGEWCHKHEIDIRICFPSSEGGQIAKNARRNYCEQHESKTECWAYVKLLDVRFERHWVDERKQLITGIGSVDLSGRDLRGADLTGAFFVRADLRRARLDGANLGDAVMEGANLTLARIAYANFRGARMESARFSQATIRGAVFVAARMRSADFLRADISETDFRNANFRNADFTDASFRDVSFANAKLFGSVFSRTSLDGVRFRNAVFGRSIFNAVDMTRTTGISQKRLKHAVAIGDTTPKPDMFLWSCWNSGNDSHYHPVLLRMFRTRKNRLGAEDWHSFKKLFICDDRQREKIQGPFSSVQD